MDRLAIKNRLINNKRKLELEGKLIANQDREDVAFEWPLRLVEDLNWNSYYGVGNFVDQDDSPTLGDYYCNARTYNGHKGTDIFTWPFPWYLYENDYVEVIAAEAGVIIGKEDDFDDDHCECFGSWNAVYVQHADGSVAWYGHLKKNSLTFKEIGEAVVKGDFLGVVASSGCSTGPHLHFEIYNADGDLIDPYSGVCNLLNLSSWWNEQPPNREPMINTVLTHNQVPEHGCPSINEDPHFENDFFVGDIVYTAFYYHDELFATESNYKIIDPDGNVWQEWMHESPGNYNASWWYWSWELPVEGPFGVWTVAANYQGENYLHEFNYGVFSNTQKNDLSFISISPNPSNSNYIAISGLTDFTSIEIYDGMGKCVKKLNMVEDEINIAELSKGVYYIRFYLNDTFVVKKIIRN